MDIFMVIVGISVVGFIMAVAMELSEYICNELTKKKH